MFERLKMVLLKENISFISHFKLPVDASKLYMHHKLTMLTIKSSQINKAALLPQM